MERQELKKILDEFQELAEETAGTAFNDYGKTLEDFERHFSFGTESDKEKILNKYAPE